MVSLPIIEFMPGIKCRIEDSTFQMHNKIIYTAFANWEIAITIFTKII